MKARTDRVTENCGFSIKHGIPSTCYINPQEISTRINAKLRKEKESETEKWKTLLTKASHDMPGASREKCQAHVFKKILQEKSGAGKDEEESFRLNCTFKPDMTNSMRTCPKKPK